MKLRAGHHFSPKLVKDIKDAIRAGLSSRHIPEYILEVQDIPVRECVDGVEVALLRYFLWQYTLNGKKIEVAVKQIVSGSQLKPSGAVANPESLKEYYKYYNIENFEEPRGKL